MTSFLAMVLSGAVISPGWDFSLPVTVKPDSYAGLIWMDNPAQRPEIVHEGHTLTWSDMNPAEGVYDFAPALRFLDEARAKGRGVLLRLKCSDVVNKTPWGERPPMIPGWVLDKVHPATVDMAGEADETYSKVVILTALPWEAGLQAEYLKFVEAFGKSGIPGHPALLGLYVHGISTSLGEEFWFDPKAFQNLVKAGMTPEKLQGAFEARIKAWAKAFGPYRGRLAWVGVGWIPAPDEDWEAYKSVQTHLNKLAVDEGLGYRGGGIERFDQVSDAAGQILAENGHFVNDWNHPILKEGRFYGDENEVYKETGDLGKTMYRAATLRALQMGMRYLWTEDEAVALDPEVSAYFNLCAGKTPEQSPDLWCLLRQGQTQVHGRKVPLRNFERGLIQVDNVDGFRTNPALFSGSRKDFAGEDSEGDWEAQVTDRSGGQKGLAFRVDRAFWGPAGSRDMTLKVTYLDQGAEWKVGYCSGRGFSETEPVKGTDNGKVKTATFLLRNIGLCQSQESSGCEVALETIRGDLTVSFVRLIR